MTRKLLLNLLKLGLAAALLWWVVDEAGGVDVILRSLSGIDRRGWVVGLLLVLAANIVAMLRWHQLMRSVGLNSTPWIALRLGFLGVFFSNIVPGLTGGDLVKAVYVTRENRQQRAAAVVSVIVDRIIGIIALALIAAVVIPFDLERFGDAALGIYGFLAAAAVGGTFALSRRAKSRLRALLGRFGRGSSGPATVLGKLDDAVSIYRHRVGALCWALAVSFVVHLLIIMALQVFGQALSDGATARAGDGGADLATHVADLQTLAPLGLDVYCAVIPIIMIISSLPVAPAGWGVGEKAFEYFFQAAGAATSAAVALSVTYRLTCMLVSLLGGVFFVLDRKAVLEASHAEGEHRDGGPPGAS